MRKIILIAVASFLWKKFQVRRSAATASATEPLPPKY